MTEEEEEGIHCVCIRMGIHALSRGGIPKQPHLSLSLGRKATTMGPFAKRESREISTTEESESSMSTYRYVHKEQCLMHCQEFPALIFSSLQANIRIREMQKPVRILSLTHTRRRPSTHVAFRRRGHVAIVVARFK